ncbi:hypothetical protein PIB30_066681 [Stylosanthes scabra]|uniref:Uncharacterized protein n=1 Tax=Stylosanthes scabra TaxID=79078 RepID=A0ABU6QLX1_9FABA|nr:hypothetical protein [Stylosanthes scabra]
MKEANILAHQAVAMEAQGRLRIGNGNSTRDRIQGVVHIHLIEACSEPFEGDSAADRLFVMDNYTDRETSLEVRISDPSYINPHHRQLWMVRTMGEARLKFQGGWVK